MKKVSELYSIWLEGDSLSDEEIVRLRDAFDAAAQANAVLGQRFRLAFLEANNQLNSVEDACRARGL